MTPQEAPEDAPQGKPCAQMGQATPAEPFLVDHQSFWLGQGTEMFSPPATRFAQIKIIGITVLAVVVLGLAAATVVHPLISGPGRTGGDHIASPPAHTPRDVPPPHPRPANTADALITPEGADRGSRPFDGELQVLELASTVYMPSAIVISLHANDVSDTVLKATTLAVGTHEVKIGMYAFTLPDEHKAITVERDIVTAEVSTDSGLEYAPALALRGVTVMRSVPGSDKPVYRAVYVLYNRVIFFEVLGNSRDHADAVLTTFSSLLDKQVITHAPPTIRPGH